MKRRSTRKNWLLAQSLASGFGLALVSTSLASAQQAKTAQLSPVSSSSASQGLRHPSSAPASPTPANRYYVSKSGDDSSGLFWTTAFKQVQDAPAVAVSGDDIRVASGVYTPGVSFSDGFDLVPV